MVGPEQIRALVADELAIIEENSRREALRSLLVEPRVEEREWDYGAPNERYAYWVVAEAPARGVILAYCERGFGPEMPWGFLFTDEPEFASLGMDSQWSWYLEEAFVRSGLWTGSVKPGGAEPLHRAPQERFRGAPPREA